MAIEYLTQPKKSFDLPVLYDALGWMTYLNISSHQLKQAMMQSYRVIYAYDGDLLVGTGRVVSDGIINAYICGIGVLDAYRNRGIGTAILEKLSSHCENQNLHIQLVCEDHLKTYYTNKGYQIIGHALKRSKLEDKV